MTSILEELYFGNIGFDSARHAPDSPYARAVRQRHACMEQLHALLDESAKEVFDAYCDAEADINGLTRYSTYCSALRFGVLLMSEIFLPQTAENPPERLA